MGRLHDAGTAGAVSKLNGLMDVVAKDTASPSETVDQGHSSGGGIPCAN
jgi:hypothetical protein